MSSTNQQTDFTSDAAQDDSYVSRPGQNDGGIPVQSDSVDVEDPIDSKIANSDEQLASDDKEAIDESNIINERTRGAKPSDGYREPGDEEGLPGAEDGTSSGGQ